MIKIIAEIGANFEKFADCLLSIQKAKLAGADIVKFQYFHATELYGPWTAKTNFSVYGHWLSHLKKECDAVGIEFMCSAFSPVGYELVNNYVETHKIASSEMVDPFILDMVNNLGKPVLLSTAGADFETEVQPALSRLKHVPVTIMYCVGDYPAKVTDFRHLIAMQEHFGSAYNYGFSDHSTDVLIIPKRASEMGITYLEKHVDFIGCEGPDSPHSLNEEEFKLMVNSIKQDTTSRETWDVSNQNMRKTYRRRLVAQCRIPIDTELVVGGNVGCFRPLGATENAVPPLQAYKLKDKRAKRSIHQGETITFDHFDEG